MSEVLEAFLERTSNNVNSCAIKIHDKEETNSQPVSHETQLVNNDLKRKKHLLMKLEQDKKTLTRRMILDRFRIAKTQGKRKTNSLTFLKKYKIPHRFKRLKSWKDSARTNSETTKKSKLPVQEKIYLLETSKGKRDKQEVLKNLNLQ